jgi:hypothetical protein
MGEGTKGPGSAGDQGPDLETGISACAEGRTSPPAATGRAADRRTELRRLTRGAQTAAAAVAALRDARAHPANPSSPDGDGAPPANQRAWIGRIGSSGGRRAVGAHEHPAAPRRAFQRTPDSRRMLRRSTHRGASAAVMWGASRRSAPTAAPGHRGRNRPRYRYRRRGEPKMAERPTRPNPPV